MPELAHCLSVQVFAGSTYHAVASDDNDFNAVLPSWGIREAYVGAANTLASVRGAPSLFEQRPRGNPVCCSTNANHVHAQCWRHAACGAAIPPLLQAGCRFIGFLTAAHGSDGCCSQPCHGVAALVQEARCDGAAAGSCLEGVWRDRHGVVALGSTWQLLGGDLEGVKKDCCSGVRCQQGLMGGG